MRDTDKGLALGNERYGSRLNARPFRCSCGGTIEKVGDDRFECDECGQMYETDDWRSDRLKPIENSRIRKIGDKVKVIGEIYTIIAVDARDSQQPRYTIQGRLGIRDRIEETDIEQ